MTDLLPFSLTEILRKDLEAHKRTPDFMLHPSTHLMGSLRHTQLELAGAPKVQSELISDIRLKTGTMWHEYLREVLMRTGLPFMSEVDLTEWLPPGWSGTADFLVWHPHYRAFVLWDLKTIKGEGMRFRERDGASEEHIWQVSSYFYAALSAGFPLLDHVGVLYLPMNDTADRRETIQPLLCEVKPVPEFDLHLRMNHIKQRVDEYLSALPDPEISPTGEDWWVTYINQYLEPEQPRVQKVYWSSKTKVFEVKLVPHWSTDYCPFPVELCACSTQGTEKIGQYDPFTLEYTPREGYEDIVPEVEPDLMEVNRRRKELHGNNYHEAKEEVA